jgi:threonine dehydratase
VANQSRVFLAVFVPVLSFFCAIFPAFAQDPGPKSGASVKLAEETEKIKGKIVKIGAGNDITIVRRDGQEFYGTISKIADDYVTVSDVDLKANVEIYYQQVRKVSKGYGNSKAWNGKRIPPKKHAIGLILGAAAIAIPVIIVLVSMRKE